MKTPHLLFARRLLILAALVIFSALSVTSSRADFALSVSLDQFGSPEQNNVSYGIFLNLDTTNIPITHFEIYSSHSNSFNGVGDGSTFNVLSLPDFQALKDELTNGPWKLAINEGDPSEKDYFFTISLNSFTSNAIFPDVNILNPVNLASDVPTNNIFSFTGPASFQSLSVSVDQGNNFFAGAGLDPSATSWVPDQPLDPDTSYDFFVQYSSDASSHLNFPTPTTTNGQTLAGWSATAPVNLVDDSKFNTVAAGISLKTALDANNLNWFTSGDAVWFGESAVSFDGISAAQSGVLQDEQMSVLQTTVSGGGSISFNWQTLGEADEFDLEFDVDGSYVTDIPSQTDWTQFTYTFTDTNTHVLTWTATSGDGSSTDDAGYVDEVVFNQNGVAQPPAGNWSATKPMLVDRGQFTLTLLGNGLALAAGGLIEGFPEASTSQADLYNPATGSWTNAAFMNTDRRAHTATVLLDGQLLVAGGTSGLLNGPKVSSSELYNPATDLWTNTTGSMHLARSGHTATRLANGLVLVAGGSGDTSSELYNPSTQNWSTTGSLNEVRNFATEFLLPNGKVLVEGGASDNTVEIYDPATAQWTFGNTMLREQDSSIAVMLTNGAVLVAGGSTTNGTTGFSEIYDPVAGSWTQTGTMRTPRFAASAVVLANGVVLVSGGDGDSGTLASAELYDPASGSWSQTGAMLDARDQFLSLLLPGGQALATGGFFATAELYSTATAGILLTNLTEMPGGGFRFSFANTAGSTNTVFATTNITAPFTNWISLGAATEISSGQFQFTDTSTSIPKRFYRVRSP